MKNLTIIIPLVEYKPEMKSLFDTSFNSVFVADKDMSSNIVLIGPSSSIKVAKEYDWGTRDVIFLENDKNISPQYQINKAIKEVKTEYFSILEYDDRYTDFWFNEVERYQEAYPEVSCFLPLIEVFDFQHTEIGSISYANEPVWSSSFSEELGFIDFDSLKNHYNFIVSGGVFRKNDFISVGGLKNSLDVFFWYEFLLRFTHNAKKTMVIPKIGYEHGVNRDGTLTSRYQNMKQDELDFWFNTAQEEYVYKTDRKKTYTAKTE